MSRSAKREDYAEAITDVQDYATWRVEKPSPEVELAAAVLSRAIMDLSFTGWWQKNAAKPAVSAVRASARDWFQSQDERPFSFIHLCSVLRLDPDAARERILSGEVATDGHSNRRDPTRTASLHTRERVRMLEYWARRKGAA